MTAGGYGQSPAQRVGVTPAGIGVRAIARFIDWIIAGLIGAVLFWLLDRVADIPSWISILPGAAFGFLYFVVFEVATGATPGKKILGLRVNGAGGAPTPNVKESALRNAYMLFNLIPWVGGILWFFAAIGIGLTVSMSSTRQGWHDNVAGGTQVVKD
ncbi:RDD family protein [Nocardia sp. 2]|uniref:RDD family protein n=1 Tax=Nocardia acididurans TaxID=2802282 RepID=A0ABS1MDF3_9NOCA|nr:RDD family protein [Nocardia acididurans]MBL1077213.1 RDD family protein [Nocardia acididurans]